VSTRPAQLSPLVRFKSNLLQLPAFVLSTIFFGSLALAVSIFDGSGHWQHRIARLWARVSVWCSLSPLKIMGAENLQKAPVAVYASNHTSYMDTPVLFSSLPFQFRILAKKGLWKIPFIGWYLQRSGQLPVDTSNTHASVASLGASVKALRAGMPVLVFPEGGRTSDGQLQEFFSGAAYLAIRAQVPLVPLALAGVYDLLPIHTRHFYPVPLTLVAGEPIETKGMNMRQVDELTVRLRAEIENLLNFSLEKDDNLAANFC
jgi:1-acyl-sn-glycerol-3-phosphate acyltransferase